MADNEVFRGAHKESPLNLSAEGILMYFAYSLGIITSRPLLVPMAGGKLAGGNMAELPECTRWQRNKNSTARLYHQYCLAFCCSSP